MPVMPLSRCGNAAGFPKLRDRGAGAVDREMDGGWIYSWRDEYRQLFHLGGNH